MGEKETGTDVPGNSLKEGITLSTSGPLLSEREVRTDGTKEQTNLTGRAGGGCSCRTRWRGRVHPLS